MSADCLAEMLSSLRTSRPHAVNVRDWLLSCADVISALPDRDARWHACCVLREELQHALPGLSPELAMLEILSAVFKAGGRT